MFDDTISNPASLTILTAISGLMKQNPETLKDFYFLNLSNPRSETIFATLTNSLVESLIIGFKFTKL